MSNIKAGDYVVWKEHLSKVARIYTSRSGSKLAWIDTATGPDGDVYLDDDLKAGGLATLYPVGTRIKLGGKTMLGELTCTVEQVSHWRMFVKYGLPWITAEDILNGTYTITKLKDE